MATNEEAVAVGPGPRGFRIALAVVATIYFIALLKHPADHIMIKKEPRLGWLLRPIAFFTQSTSLFPSADLVITEFRLEAWVCASQSWQPLDPRPYFPIEADDKESRFQRLGYFYRKNRTVMAALEDFIVAHHTEDGADDGVSGRISGIRLRHLRQPIPEPGADVPRYHYDPLKPLAPDEDLKNYYVPTTREVRKARCSATN